MENRPEHVVEIKLTEALKAAADLGNEVILLRRYLREITGAVNGGMYKPDELFGAIARARLECFPDDGATETEGDAK